MNIKIKEINNKGFVIAEENSSRLGTMTYSISQGLIIIDHTEVNESAKGKGVGLKLLNKLVAKARKEDIKVIPLCPFANAMFKRHEDIRDVLKL